LGYAQLVAGDGDSKNQSSIALHQSVGFEHRGILRDVGMKHGQWLDIVLMPIVPLICPSEVKTQALNPIEMGLLPLNTKPCAWDNAIIGEYEKQNFGRLARILRRPFRACIAFTSLDATTFLGR
jgi:hypothetical protein